MPAQKITKEQRCYREVKAAMALKDLTCDKLARRIGAKSGQRVSDWRRNIYRVTPDKILMMSDILGISIFDIMTKYWKEEKA